MANVSLRIEGSAAENSKGDSWTLGDAASDALNALKTVAGVMLVGAAIVLADRRAGGVGRVADDRLAAPGPRAGAGRVAGAPRGAAPTPRGPAPAAKGRGLRGQ